jgi:transcriptional regulator
MAVSASPLAPTAIVFARDVHYGTIVSMYTPTAFAEPDVAVLHQCVRAHPLGALVTLTPDGIEANHIPFLVSADPPPFGTLRGHVARANPVWRDSVRDARCLVIFQGPNSYVSPTWYPTKEETGKVVPTWNYVVVHARGRMRVIEDPAWIATHVAALTEAHEEGRTPRWHTTDAPADFIAAMTRAIVGIEIQIEELAGKWKVSQNRPAADRAGVIEGLEREGTASGDAISMTMRSVEQRKNEPAR